MDIVRQATRKLKLAKKSAAALDLTTVSLSTTAGRQFLLQHAPRREAMAALFTANFVLQVGFGKDGLRFAHDSLGSLIGVLEAIVCRVQITRAFAGCMFPIVGLTHTEFEEWDCKLKQAEARGFTRYLPFDEVLH
jgi:hypothetical protein